MSTSLTTRSCVWTCLVFAALLAVCALPLQARKANENRDTVEVLASGVGGRKPDNAAAPVPLGYKVGAGTAMPSGATVVKAQATSSASIAVPKGPLFLVPNDIAEVNASNSTPIHDYGPNQLMLVPGLASLPSSVRNRITAIDDTTTISYRGWKGVVPQMSDAAVLGLGDAYYLVALVGPPDESWLQQFASLGVTVVGTASPYGLVVHANGNQLLGAVLSISTSYGYSVVRGILPIPLKVRLSGELLRVVRGQETLGDIPGLRRASDGSAVVRLFYYNDPVLGQKPLDRRAARLTALRKRTRTPNAALAYGYNDAVLIRGPKELLHILQSIPSVEYVEALHERQADNHAQVYYPIAMAVSPPLYTIKPILPPPGTKPKLMPEKEIPPWVNGRNKPGPLIGVPSEKSVLQSWVGTLSIPTPINTFEGLGAGLSGFTVAAAPPDTEGDVGPNDYVQWVNSMFAIFSKSTGAVLYGPANGNTLFTALGGSCAADNSGDPLVMYDRIANRWFMSQFAVSASPYYQCIAVSQTSDPVTTAWNLYAYSYGTNFNDYGKSGVWPDGYYMMFHMFANGSTWAGTEVCAFDRVKMLAGQVATQQCFGPNTNYGGLLPSNLQGSTLPPTGAPNYFVAYGTNQLLFWPFHVDWTTPANSTFPFSSPSTLTVAAFTEPCGGTGGTCVPQPGTTQQLDTLGDRLMWRMNYRNFGTYQSWVFNHTVTGGAGTGVRWYELRDLATSPTVYQQGTFAPADTTWRWMGSVNMDKDGDIAAGYSGSSSTLYPSIMYTGRLATDPLGTFPQGEATLYSGTGSQTTTLSRWGDYSSMSIDPSDDCTFWYTTEYLAASGTFNWHTRIGSFKFSSCVACTTPGIPTGLTATVPGNNEIDLSWTAGTPAGATYNVYRATGTCPQTTYSLLASGVTATTYSDTTVSGTVTYAYVLTAVDSTGGCESAQSTCAQATATGACTLPPTFGGLTSVTNPANANCELDLAWSAATSNCGGSITYNVYRSTTTGFTPGPTNLIATAVTTLTYADTNALANGTPYYYVVRAVDSANGIDDANTVEKSGAPTGPTTISTLTETFEDASGFDLPGWTHEYINGTVDWAWSTAGNPQTPTHDWFAQDTASASDMVLVSPSFGVGSSTVLTFWHTYAFEGTTTSCYDGSTLEYTTDGGTTWTVFPAADFTAGAFTGTINSSYSNPIGGKAGWCAGTVGTMTEVSVNLGGDSNLLNKTVQVRWHEGNDSSNSSTGWYVDSVTIANAQTQSSCTTAGAVKPVPDGKWIAGTEATATKTVADGSSINLTWDTSTCQNTNYNLYYGNGSGLATYTLSGSNCGLGNTGTATWTAVPAVPTGETFIWWTIVGTDGVQTESSWGKDSAGTERHPAASGQCGFTAKSTATTCP